MSDITYKYALTKDDKLIDIELLTITNKQDNDYKCISCGEILIPKLGNIRAHHFSHLDDNICSKETYLHKLGKLVFYYNYINCIQNNLEYNIEYVFTKECNYFLKKYNQLCSYQDEQIFNLVKYFPNIKYQKKEDNFIPDLLLIDNNNINKIFIEIFVTHHVTDEKINSKNRIIEIKINEEKDIDIILKNLLSYKDEHISFYNIQKINVRDNCKGKCKKNYSVIYFDMNGEIKFSNLKLNEIEDDNILEYYILNDKEKYNNDLIKVFAAKCSKKKFFVKNCNLCKYHMLDKFKQNEYEPIYCKLLNFVCDSKKAEKCESYVEDYKIVKRIKLA